LELELELEGRRPDVRLDSSFELNIAGKGVSMMLTAKPWRTFTAADIEFRYPAAHAFADEQIGPQTHMWTLDGSDNVLMVVQVTDGSSSSVRESMAQEAT
jgi:hypothetical protein